MSIWVTIIYFYVPLWNYDLHDSLIMMIASFKKTSFKKEVEMAEIVLSNACPVYLNESQVNEPTDSKVFPLCWKIAEKWVHDLEVGTRSSIFTFSLLSVFFNGPRSHLVFTNHQGEKCCFSKAWERKQTSPQFNL